MMRKGTTVVCCALLLMTGCVVPVDIEVDTDGSGSHGIQGSGRPAAYVRGGTLHLGPKSSVAMDPEVEPVYRVEAAALDGITGSGVVAFEANLGGQPELTVHLSGVCGLDVHGSVDRLHALLSGVTSFRGPDLVSRVADVVASGVSWAVVNVTDRLEAHASGNASIRYLGPPDQLLIETSGLGTVLPY